MSLIKLLSRETKKAALVNNKVLNQPETGVICSRCQLAISGSTAVGRCPRCFASLVRHQCRGCGQCIR